MEPRGFKIIELWLVFGGALVFGIWQWVAVRRELRRDRERQAAAELQRQRGNPPPPG